MFRKFEGKRVKLVCGSTGKGMYDSYQLVNSSLLILFEFVILFAPCEKVSSKMKESLMHLLT